MLKSPENIEVGGPQFCDGDGVADAMSDGNEPRGKNLITLVLFDHA